MKSLEEFADEQAAAKYAENQELARTARVLRSTLRSQEDELSRLRERVQLLDAMDAAEIAPPKWLVPKARRGVKHLAIPTLFMTDIHWGEHVRPEEIGGVNKFNREIARMRVRKAPEGAIKLCRDYLSGFEYEGCNLLLGGDLISGEIHDELRETNDGTLPESILDVVEHLIAAAKLLADYFGKVHIESVVGNHGRTTQKKRSKRKARDSFDWLAYQFIARELQADPRVTMRVATGSDQHFSVYGTRYVLTHGDQFNGGSGISGFLTPVLLGAHRKRRRDAQAGKHWDVLAMGHFHQSYPLKDVIVGGAIIGYNEYAADHNFPIEEAQASFWLNTPERGVTCHMPVCLQDREAEGW